MITKRDGREFSTLFFHHYPGTAPGRTDDITHPMSGSFDVSCRQSVPQYPGSHLDKDRWDGLCLRLEVLNLLSRDEVGRVESLYPVGVKA